MERYFIVTEESELHKDYFAWRDNYTPVNNHVKEFFEQNEIEAAEYYAAEDALYIVPSEDDAEKYGSVLLKDEGNGLRRFKKNSKISKLWVESVKEKGLEILMKPRLIFYLPSLGGGRFKTRLFHHKGKLYCSRDPFGEMVPNGFVELKASEFFKVIEDAEGEE